MVSDDRLVRESTDTYAFLERVNGVVPGYSGFRPGAKTICFKSGYGGVPRPTGSSRVSDGSREWVRNPMPPPAPGQGENLSKKPTTSWMELGTEWKEAAPPSANQKYLVASGGVKMGYTGFVPHSRKHFGSSHKGGVDGTRSDLVAQRRSAQGAREIPDASVPMGTLQTPGMIEDASVAFVGLDPARVPVQPRGGAILGYGGHRPTAVNEMSDSPRASITPYRRHFREVSDKVGIGANRPASASAVTGRAPRRGDPPPPVLRPATQALGVNDWVVHQTTPPPGLAPDSAEYVRDVGGVSSGYAGFVPHSASHCGSAHVGMRGRESSLPQRGHTGKVDGRVLRVQAERDALSRLAGGAVVGYGGHLPGAQLSFGMSAWKPDDATAYSA